MSTEAISQGDQEVDLELAAKLRSSVMEAVAGNILIDNVLIGGEPPYFKSRRIPGKRESIIGRSGLGFVRTTANEIDICHCSDDHISLFGSFSTTLEDDTVIGFLLRGELPPTEKASETTFYDETLGRHMASMVPPEFTNTYLRVYLDVLTRDTVVS